MTVDTHMDADSLELLEDALRKTMLSASGPELDAALTELGWADMLSGMPDVAVPLVFRLLGETGSHASVLVDVVLNATGNTIGATVELPLTYAGNSWVVWDSISTESLDPTPGAVTEDEGGARVVDPVEVGPRRPVRRLDLDRPHPDDAARSTPHGPQRGWIRRTPRPPSNAASPAS